MGIWGESYHFLYFCACLKSFTIKKFLMKYSKNKIWINKEGFIVRDWHWHEENVYHLINQSILSLEHDNSCILFNKTLWRADNRQDTVLGATGDKKVSEAVSVCKGLTIWRTEPNHMGKLKHGFRETLIFEMCLESNTTVRGERGLRKLGWILERGKKNLKRLSKGLLDLAHSHLSNLIFHHFLYGYHQTIWGTE